MFTTRKALKARIEYLEQVNHDRARQIQELNNGLLEEIMHHNACHDLAQRAVHEGLDKIETLELENKKLKSINRGLKFKLSSLYGKGIAQAKETWDQGYTAGWNDANQPTITGNNPYN